MKFLLFISTLLSPLKFLQVFKELVIERIGGFFFCLVHLRHIQRNPRVSPNSELVFKVDFVFELVQNDVSLLPPKKPIQLENSSSFTLFVVFLSDESLPMAFSMIFPPTTMLSMAPMNLSIVFWTSSSGTSLA